MPETTVQPPQTPTSLNGVVALTMEARLRHFFCEQARLREILERTRADMDRINAELFRFQDEYCTDAARQEEYDSAIERILGITRIDPKEIEEALAGKGVYDFKELIEELERTHGATPSQEAR
ncbi:MAG TPA: hypothetical protein VKA46_33225 [Gemmataceae bacterium]|nr:hypothetical protein [Gemmataceae bacterium]